MKKYYWRVCYSICKHLHKHSINYTLILIYFTFFFLSDRIVICAIIKQLFLTFYTPIIISCQLQTRLSACLFSSVKCLDRVPLVHLYLFLSNNWFFFFFSVVDFYTKYNIGVQSHHVWWKYDSIFRVTKALYSRFPTLW